MQDTSRRNARSVGGLRYGTQTGMTSSVSPQDVGIVARTMKDGLVLLGWQAVPIMILPELCEVVVREGLCDQFAAWMIIRKIDHLTTSGGGRVRKAGMIRLLCDLMGISRRKVQKMVADGKGLFWRDGRNGFLYLMGIDQLCRLLDAENIFSKWMTLPLESLCITSTPLKSMLVCLVASKNDRPVSIANLVDRLGISERSLHYYIEMNQGDKFFSRNNACVISRTEDRLDAFRKCQEIKRGGSWAEIVESSDGMFHVCRRMPNTFMNTLRRSGTSRIRYRLRMRTGRRSMLQTHTRTYAKGKENGAISHVGLWRNMYSPVFSIRNGRLCEMWEERES